MKVHFTAAFSILVGIAIGDIAVRGLNAQTRPPAYVIGEIEVADQENYAKEYLSRSQKPIITDGGGKFLSRGSNSQKSTGLIGRKLRLTLRPMLKLSCMVKGTQNSGFLRSRVVAIERSSHVRLSANDPKRTFVGFSMIFIQGWTLPLSGS
jgi:hypothetical protein